MCNPSAATSDFLKCNSCGLNWTENPNSYSVSVWICDSCKYAPEWHTMQWTQAPELNARFEVRRALPEHYEESELALDPIEVRKFIGEPLPTSQNDDGTQQSRCTHDGCGHMCLFADEKQLATQSLYSNFPWPCFVDGCNFTGLPPNLVGHVRSAHGIAEIPAWAWTRHDDWLKKNPHKCPVKSCYLHWRGCATKKQISSHIRISHWVDHKNKIARDCYVCHICAEFRPELYGRNSKMMLFEHLEMAHHFSYTLPFDPMESEV